MRPKRFPGTGLPDGSGLAQVEQGGGVVTVRIIQYQISGFRPARRLTTLLDPAISAWELVIHYHRRWDIEIAYDEIKTHQCATLRGHAPTFFRSKKPELVEQELYAVLIIYTVVRDLIHEAVAQQPQSTRDISFLESLQCVIEAIPQMSTVEATPADIQLQYLRSWIAECLIDRPRRHRINPRVVKVKMSKRKSHKSSHRDIENEIQILKDITA